MNWPVLAALTAYTAACVLGGWVVNVTLSSKTLKQWVGHGCALVLGGTAANLICQWAGCSIPAADLLILHAGLAYMIHKQ